MAFTTYFAMYSFRKPFAAAHFNGAHFWILDLKSALIISQLCGYALSKFLGVKFNYSGDVLAVLAIATGVMLLLRRFD